MGNRYQPMPTEFQLNENGTYSAAIPLPLKTIFQIVCPDCKKRFFKNITYRQHYNWEHTDGLEYRYINGKLNAVDRHYE